MQVAPRSAAWSYNNAGFSVAGRVIEAVTGTSINRAIRDLIFTPLGLAFFGDDRAVITAGADRGQSIEFIRAADHTVTWIRVVGRVAVRAKP